MKKFIFSLCIILGSFTSCSEAPKQQSTPLEQTPTTAPPTEPATTQKDLAPTMQSAKVLWRCFGTEPFWAVEISEEKNTMVFRPMEGDTLVMPFTQGIEKDNTWTFNSAKIKAVLKKETCSDGMSDTEHQYSASVTVDGKILKGCAKKL